MTQYFCRTIPLYSLVELPDGRQGLLWVVGSKTATVLVNDGLAVEVPSRTRLNLLKPTALIVREALLEKITQYNLSLEGNTMPIKRLAKDVTNHSLVKVNDNQVGILEKEHDDERFKGRYLLYLDSMMTKSTLFPHSEVEVIDTELEIVIGHLERYLDQEANYS